MKKRLSRDQRFMNRAHSALAWGTCPRARVGAVLARGGLPLGPAGYNGAPSKQRHCDDVGCLVEDGHCIRALHAEYNVIKLVGYWNCAGATLYVTHIPCYRCANMIVDAKIACIVYESDYGKDERALRLLMSAGEVYRFVDGKRQRERIIEEVGRWGERSVEFAVKEEWGEG